MVLAFLDDTPIEGRVDFDDHFANSNSESLTSSSSPKVLAVLEADRVPWKAGDPEWG